MLPKTVLRLSSISNIVGIKEATGDLQRAQQIISQCPADFAVYSGDDHTARELMLLGGKGDISVTANVAPAMMAQLCAAALAGDAARAAQIDKIVQNKLNEYGHKILLKSYVVLLILFKFQYCMILSFLHFF